MDLEYYQFHLLLLDFLCFQSQWHKLFGVLQKISQNYQDYTSYAGQWYRQQIRAIYNAENLSEL